MSGPLPPECGEPPLQQGKVDSVIGPFALVVLGCLHPAPAVGSLGDDAVDEYNEFTWAADGDKVKIAPVLAKFLSELVSNI